MSNPFVGGLINAQFSNFDLNNDGVQDLIVFDRFDDRILTFINRSKGGDPDLFYDPRYESYFPAFQNTVIFEDYNNDGKPDIFTYKANSIDLWKNISTGKNIKFLKPDTNLKVNYVFLDDNKFDTSVFDLFILNNDIPAIADIDNDGDLDFIVFSILGQFVELNKNMAVEMGYPLDSFILVNEAYKNTCWGHIKESDTARLITLGECPLNKKKKKHAGSTLALFDHDNDGDLDLVVGDIGYSQLTYLENGKVDFGLDRDSFISVSYDYPLNTTKAKTPIFPAAFFVDVNNDNKKDLIITPQDEMSSKTYGQIWLYLDKGTNKPDFQYKQDNFLQDHMIDLGNYSSPAFSDFDNDGDLDLFVAAGSVDLPPQSSHIVLFENVGSAKKPVFKKLNDDFAGLSSENYKKLAITFADLDHDNDEDLLIGTENGSLIYYQNKGKNSFEKKALSITSSNVITDFSYPVFYDFNKDGKPDLFVGEGAGNIDLFLNTGTKTAPAFTLYTEKFNGIKALGLNAAPAIGDLDNNGGPDMIVGFRGTPPALFNNLSSDTSVKVNPGLEFIYDPVTQNPGMLRLGNDLKPALADLDGDGKTDIIFGNSRGGLIFLGTKKGYDDLPIGIEEPADLDLSIYPNPANKELNIALKSHEKYSHLEIYDLLGHQIFLKAVNEEISHVQLNNFKRGIYILRIIGSNNQVITKKFVIIK